MNKKKGNQERGNSMLRRLDWLVGIPLVRILSLLRHRPQAIPCHPKCIAVLCFGAIGDTLLTTALLRALANSYPDARIHICSSMDNAAALPLLGPRYTTATFPIRAVAAFVRHLRALKADVLIDTSQWARIGAIVSLLSGAGFTIGFDTPGQARGCSYDQAVLHCGDRHEVENFLSLARVLTPSVTAAPALYIQDIPPQGLNLELFPPLDKIVYLHMFASGRNSHLKEWSEDRWREVALACCKAGYAVAITGSPADVPRAENFLREQIPEVLTQSGKAILLAGKVSLPELAWLMQRGGGAVSVNTGILHLAALCGLPVVGLHGPTNPLRWGGCGPHVVSLLAPGQDTAYLNLGFEFPADAEASLNRLSAEDVCVALRGLGLAIGE